MTYRYALADYYRDAFNIVFSKYVLIFIGSLLLFTYFLKIYLRRRSRKNFEVFKYNGKQYQLSPGNLIPIPTDDTLESHFHIPLDSSLEQFFFVSYIYNLPNAASNLVSAYILRWIYRGYIEQDYRLSTGKEEMDITLKIIKKPKNMSQEESILWAMIDASKMENKNISTTKLIAIVKKNSQQISLWISSVARTGAIAFFKKNYLEPDIHSKKTVIPMLLNDKGKQAITDFFKFRTYLENFTLLEQRSMPEVSLWDDYLIAATSLGLGKKVAAQMNRIVPTFSFLQNYFVLKSKNGTLVRIEFFSRK